MMLKKKPIQVTCSARTNRLPFRWLIITTLLAAMAIGCGPSKNDLIMRAAQRRRPTADEDDNAKPPPPEKQQQTEQQQTAPPPSARAQRKPEETETEEVDAEPKIPEKPLLTLEERKKALSTEDKRSMAANNIVAIGEALEKYHEEHGYYPLRHHIAAGGLETLSWRVTLLPYLGYKTLHDKFDFAKPWYMEPNKSLLQYIPQEYISPERYDTKTNYQLPAYRTFLFGEFKTHKKSDVEDGLSNTLLLIEVNDDLAVEWTSPLDYIPEVPKQYKRDLGGVREDGFFAIWCNGWPTLIPNDASENDIHAALTYESGDGNVARRLHRPVTIGGASDGAMARAERNDSPDLDAPAPAIKSSGPPEPLEPLEAIIERDEVPIAGEIQEASERLRKLYSDDLREADNDDDNRELAQKMLDDAARMVEDPGGAYALFLAAERLAIEGSSAKILIDAVDQRVGRFELDAYDVNLESLTNFVDGAKSKPEYIEGRDEFIERAISAIYAAITQNDFVRAGKLARQCSRIAATKDRNDTTEIPKLLNRFGSQLLAAKVAYEKAKDDLVLLRINPDNDEAAARFGQFLCFFKGDWKMGLPMLARSKNEDLAAVAKLDMSNPGSIDEQVALGDSWWEMSRRANGVYRQAAQDRAVLWYESAFEVMPESLDRIHVKNQLQEARDADPASPLSMCLHLAEQLNVDLTVNLAAVANAKFKSRSGLQ